MATLKELIGQLYDAEKARVKAASKVDVEQTKRWHGARVDPETALKRFEERKATIKAAESALESAVSKEEKLRERLVKLIDAGSTWDTDDLKLLAKYALKGQRP